MKQQSITCRHVLKAFFHISLLCGGLSLLPAAPAESSKSTETIPSCRDTEALEQMLRCIEAPREKWDQYKRFAAHWGAPAGEDLYPIIDGLMKVATTDDYLALVCPESRQQLVNTPQGRQMLVRLEESIRQGTFPYPDRGRTRAFWLVKEFDMEIPQVHFAVEPTHVLTHFFYDAEHTMLSGKAWYIVKTGDAPALVAEVLTKVINTPAEQEQAETAPTEPADLLEYLIQQNEAARAKIRSFACSLDIISNGRPQTAQLKQQGNCLWVNRDQSYPSDRVRGHQTRMVVNDRYMAEYTLAVPKIVMSHAYWCEYPSFAAMDSDIKRRIRNNTPDDFLAHCFGNSRRSFREAMAIRPGMIRWDAVRTTDTDGQTVYQIRRFPALWGNVLVPDTVWTVDPDKGFLVTQCSADIGEVSWHRSIQVEEAAPGVCFPVAFQEERYRLIGNRKLLDGWKRVSVRDLAVNVDMPDAQFEIEALNLLEDAPDVTILRKKIDGSTVPYVYHDGKLYPADVVDRTQAADRKAREEAEQGASTED